MKNLEILRAEIDMLDDEIAELYKKRMECSKYVGIYKQENNISTVNTLREKEILNRVVETMPKDIKLFAKEVYTTLFDTSKAYQWRYIGVDSPLRMKIEEVLLEGVQAFPVSATVACQGLAGAYSSIAADKLFKLSNIMYFKDFDSVFSAVEQGLCDYGVLPIENSTVGSVTKVYDLMRKHKYSIVRAIKMRIRHCLLVPAGVKIEDIKEIFSHEQAIGQCEDFLKALNIKLTVCANTAIGAKIVADSDRRDIACISSAECAGIYGLEILASNIQDNDQNYTRFIAISKDMQIFEDSDKISISVNLAHESGSLNKLLNKFSTLGLSLTKLESRPLLNSSFEFSFYFDFEAKISAKEVLNLLAEIDSSNTDFVFLGSYKEL